MKTITKITALIFIITIINANAQYSLDLFLLNPQSSVSRHALGGGINLLSKAVSVGTELEIRAGGGIHGSLLMNSNFSNIPLASPQVGNSTVRFNNWMYGGNGMVRFSLPYSRAFIPYVDVFAGMQGYSCFMTVEPDKEAAKQYSTTTESIANINHYNYGFSGGLMFSVSQNFKLDVGITTIYSKPYGQVVDVKAARVESNSISLNKINPPSMTMMFKVGVVFCFDDFLGKSSGNSSKSCGCKKGSSGGSTGGSWGGSSGGGGTGGKVNFNFKPKT